VQKLHILATTPVRIKQVFCFSWPITTAQSQVAHYILPVHHSPLVPGVALLIASFRSHKSRRGAKRCEVLGTYDVVAGLDCLTVAARYKWDEGRDAVDLGRVHHSFAVELVHHRLVEKVVPHKVAVEEVHHMLAVGELCHTLAVAEVRHRAVVMRLLHS
jgi:hypothetical protein